MANSFFKFKQFTIFHDKCAMKVGTDGMLLGAWCDTDNCQRILDVGCGTGLISLMIAQRSPAHIDAIDIDSNACMQALENANRSPFAGQVDVFHSSLADYVAKSSFKSYDLIVSNPPFFNNSLKCPDKQRNTARHTDTLPLPALLSDCKDLLASNGRLCLILPSDQLNILEELAIKNHLYKSKQTDVYPTPTSSAKRILIEYAAEPVTTPVNNRLVIEKERHLYSEEFTELAKDYYLYL